MLKKITIIVAGMILFMAGYKIAPQEIIIIVPNIDPMGIGVPPSEMYEPDEEQTFKTLKETAIELGVDFKTVKDTTTATGTALTFEYKGVDLNVSFDNAGWNNCRNGMWGTSTPEFCELQRIKQVNGNMRTAIDTENAMLKKKQLIDYSNELIQ